MNYKKLKNVLFIVCALLFTHQSTGQTVKMPTNFKATVQKEYSKMRTPELSFVDYYAHRKIEYAKKNSTQTASSGSQSNTTICDGGDFETTQVLPIDWIGDYGVQTGGFPNFNSPGVGLLTGNFTGPLGLGTSRHTLVDNSVVDPLVGISRVSPSSNSNIALRIGNSVTGCGYEMVSKQFNVSSTESLISFWYATVLVDPSNYHTEESHPSFWVRVTDLTTGTELPGVVDLGNGTAKIYADINDPFFQVQGTLAYRDWSCVQIDLSTIIGHDVEISFINEDCGLCGHYGYTYIDNFCGNCTGGPTGSIDFDLNSSDCGIGTICFDYTLPIDPNGNVGQVVIDLEIYQNGSLVSTVSSPVLTSGSKYCFQINPANITGLNGSLDGFDFIGKGHFSLNGFGLPTQQAGSLPDGQFMGLNNDYLIECGTSCWLEEIKPHIIITDHIDVINGGGKDLTKYIQMPASTTITTNQLWEGKYYIPDGVVITVENAILDLTNVDLIFGECAGIVFRRGATVRANNSVFRPCEMNKTWIGFIFDGEANGVINESTFKNAQVALGFAGVDSAYVRIVNNLFENCRIGVGAYRTHMMDGITGNTFYMDRNEIEYRPGCTSEWIANHPNPYVGQDYEYDHWGILSGHTDFFGNITQNDFVNAQEIEGSGSAKLFYGLTLNDATTAQISDNNFSDMYRSMDINASSNVFIDNNEIEVNSYNYKGDLKSEHQIAVSSSFNVNITSNDLSYAFLRENQDIPWNTHSAIYVEKSSRINVVNNKVAGFESGIQLESVRNTLVKENVLSDVGYCGVYVNTGKAIDVICNTIDMEDDYETTSLGIYYTTVSEENPGVRFSGNCIFEASTSMLLEGVMDRCYELPMITNNFMYNYTSFGIDARYLTGTIGTAGNAYDGGRNTFASNNTSTGAVDIRSVNCPISTDGNYGVITTTTNVMVGNNEYYSTASCGTQLPSTTSSLEDNYNETCDPVFYFSEMPMGSGGSGAFVLNDDVDKVLGSYDVNSHVKNWYNTLKNSKDVLAQLNSKILTIDVEVNRAWIEYNYAFVMGDYTRALGLLNSMKTEGSLTQGRIAIEEIYLALATSDKLLSATSEYVTILRELREGDDREVEYEATQLLKMVFAGNDFPFLPIRKMKGIKATGVKLLNRNKLVIYPNPVTTTMTIDFYYKSESAVSLEVLNLMGEVVISKDLESSSDAYTMDVSSLRKGAYIIQLISDDDEPTMVKFLKL